VLRLGQKDRVALQSAGSILQWNRSVLRPGAFKVSQLDASYDNARFHELVRACGKYGLAWIVSYLWVSHLELREVYELRDLSVLDASNLLSLNHLQLDILFSRIECVLRDVHIVPLHRAVFIAQGGVVPEAWVDSSWIEVSGLHWSLQNLGEDVDSFMRARYPHDSMVGRSNVPVAAGQHYLVKENLISLKQMVNSKGMGRGRFAVLPAWMCTYNGSERARMLDPCLSQLAFKGGYRTRCTTEHGLVIEHKPELVILSVSATSVGAALSSMVVPPVRSGADRTVTASIRPYLLTHTGHPVSALSMANVPVRAAGPIKQISATIVDRTLKVGSSGVVSLVDGDLGAVGALNRQHAPLPKVAVIGSDEEHAVDGECAVVASSSTCTTCTICC
jgi:hypothetical protein